MAPSTNREEVAARRAAVISTMISSLKRGELREYYVGLVGYHIEGIPYSATGLSVSPAATPDIDLSDVGFSCTAFFAPELLSPSTVNAKGTIQKKDGERVVELVPVRLEVKLVDVWAVAEFIQGKQHDLFQDSKTLELRMMMFLPERN